MWPNDLELILFFMGSSIVGNNHGVFVVEVTMKKTKLTKKDFSALHHFLDLAWSDYDQSLSANGEKTKKEIEKLQNKLLKIQNEQEKVKR